MKTTCANLDHKGDDVAPYKDAADDTRRDEGEARLFLPGSSGLVQHADLLHRSQGWLSSDCASHSKCQSLVDSQNHSSVEKVVEGEEGGRRDDDEHALDDVKSRLTLYGSIEGRTRKPMDEKRQPMGKQSAHLSLRRKM